MVRITAVGVCGSDLLLQSGGFGTSVTVPIVPGHEAAGVVDSVGAGVTDLSVGDSVALYYIDTPRGDPYTDKGRPNISPQVRRLGVDVDGAYAEKVVWPARGLVKVPPSVPPEATAVLTDSVAVPLHALKRIARVEFGETVVVIGVGGVGSSAIQLARIFGARTIVAVSRSRWKLDEAVRLGADFIVQADSTENVDEQVKAKLGGRGADIVLQCSPSSAMNAQAVRMAGPGGRVVIVGASGEAFSVRGLDLIWGERTVMGSRGTVPEDIADAVDLYTRDRVSIEHLVATVRPLEEANDALDDLRNGNVWRSILAP